MTDQRSEPFDVAARWEPVKDVMVLTMMAGVFYGIWRLNLWAATWLERKVAEADALEEALR